MQDTTDAATIYQRPAELLQWLLRFNTTNPPGAEGPCIEYIRFVLAAAGIESTILALDPDRPNLIARIPGSGDAPPLLLYGHVDVVTTEGQDWTRPPFAGEIVDGYVWGRGALDMKGGVAMMLSAFLRAKAEEARLPGDVIFLALSDEEESGTYGARFITEEHRDLFDGVRYALGEFGGFSIALGTRRFYPIMVAEKQGCHVRATVRGPGGHGSLPMRGGTMARLARLLHTLDRNRLPVHITPVVRAMIEAVAKTLPTPNGPLLCQLLTPRLTDRILDALGERGKLFDPLLHNTVNATIVRGGEKGNVIPSEVTVDMDGRILPGYTQDELLRELRALVGSDVELEAVEYDISASAAPDMTLFEALGGILREADPEGIPIPYMMSGVTDGRFFARLGIQTYGFTPMRLPPDFAFTSLIHAADERVPVEAVSFGADAVYQALLRFGAK
ncbi:MAG TPA: M20/M25/M40 family metallo-hydrolase [Ktedonobacterales bacterium]|jgi:acetylornithine deacetylase/succinyl-diaminopimelate desuccinylase-like protein